MPSIMTHAVIGAGLARVFISRPMPPVYWILAGSLAMLPDLDVIAFAFHIPYGAPLGHRGFAHSIFCALLVSLLVAFGTYRFLALSWWLCWTIFFIIMASHGLLDAFTNGGMGIALWAPFDWNRYFFSWTPIQVSPIGMGFFSRYGLRAFLSEVYWVWAPGLLLVGGVELFRTLLSARHPRP